MSAVIRNRAYARAALVGNPSDGYGGRTISVLVRNFWAEVTLEESNVLEIIPAQDDRVLFGSVHELVDDVRHHGYYGGLRLIKATIRRFVDYCQSRGLALHDRPFAIRYETSVPRQVGLGGSSAIVVAALRCLMDHYGISVGLPAQPSLALSVEHDELGIAAGLQDRVIKVYEGLVYMDFSPSQEREVDGQKCYAYEKVDPALLPPLYLSYSVEKSEPTEVFHGRLRARFEGGDIAVASAMRRCAELAQEARKALLAGDRAALGYLMDLNFDERRRISSLPAWQLRMVDTARACGATANFAGSGGAIVGTYGGAAMLEALTERLAKVGCRTVLPIVQEGQPSHLDTPPVHP